MSENFEKPFSVYLEFKGGAVNAGEIDPVIAGKTLIAFSRLLKKYQKDIDSSGLDFSLKLKNIYKGSSGLELVPDILQIMENLAETESMTLFAKTLVGYHAVRIFQVQEFFKGFMSTLGTQAALRVSSKGTVLSEKKSSVNDDNSISKICIDENGREYKLNEKEWKAYQVLSPILGDMVAFKSGDGVEKMSFGFKDSGKKTTTGEIVLKNTEYFEPSFDLIEERMTEPFDESKAEPVTIEGRFVDYHGMAHKYFFSFQVRRDVEKYGKKKILCLLEKESVSKVLDLLKPENAQNVILSGKAIRDKENKLDKIKIDSWVDKSGHGSNQDSLPI